jgi:ATP-binding cassette subfamily D (ALD) protein 4
MDWAGGWLSLLMRRSLTFQLHSELLRNLYDLKSVDLDNPDQRITQDVDKLALAVGYILEKIVVSPLLIVYYTIQLVQIDGWNAPLSLFAFFILSMIVSRVVIGPMARVIFKKEEKEGNLRYVHLRLLNSVDEVCFLNGQNAEKNILDSKLIDLLKYQKYLIYWQMLISFLTGTLDYLGTLISYTVVALPILMGSVEPDA